MSMQGRHCFEGHMTELQTDLANLANLLNRFAPSDGFHELSLSGTRCIKISQPTLPAKQYWRASMSIIAQGCKEITLGHEMYRCDAAHSLATPVDLPVISRVCSATPEKPFLCLQLLFDPLTLSEVTAQIEQCSPQETESPVRAVFLGKASGPMLDAAVRLGRLCLTPEDAPSAKGGACLLKPCRSGQGACDGFLYSF